MFNMKAALVLFTLAVLASAKTDMSGCVSSETVAFGGASLLWYVPGSGEICAFLDCGGGRAPPKTTVPGCPQYDGTATYTPSFLPGFNGNAATVPSATSTAQSTGAATPSSALITGSRTTAAISQQTTTIVSSSSSEVSSTTSISIQNSSSSETAAGQPTTNTQSTSGSTSSSSSATASTVAGNSAAVNYKAHGLGGIVAVGLALVL